MDHTTYHDNDILIYETTATSKLFFFLEEAKYLIRCTHNAVATVQVIHEPMVTVNIQVESTPLADGFKTRALSSLVFGP